MAALTLITVPITASAAASTSAFNRACSRYTVEANNGNLYCIFVDSAADVVYQKSTDGGVTWAAAVVVFAGSTVQLSIWFDRWSNISAGLIHCAYTESGGSDTLYRTIDTENSDTLSTQTTIFAGSSAAANGSLSITRARGGNVFCMVCIDAGVESTTKKLVNANVPNGAWSAALTAGTEAATQDQWLLLPGWAADNQDIMCFFWDADADEISRKLYDDSANSWSETSIAATMVDVAASSTYPHFAATVDITNSRNLLVAWSGVDTANADLRCWHITESAITEVTNVVLNSTDDQGGCAIGIDTDTQDWYVYYGGAAGGAETWATHVQIYRKVSTDDGSTWGSETQVSAMPMAFGSLNMTPRFSGTPTAELINNASTITICAFIDVTIGGGADTDRAAHLVNGGLVQ